MTQLFDRLVNFYESINWEVEKIPNETILSVTYGGENGQWVFVASTDEENGLIVMFARVPESCPKEKFNVMSEFFDRANFGMTHGAWVMDRRDGEMRYRVGVDLETMDVGSPYIKELTLYTNLTMEKYLPAIQAILRDQVTAEEAFEQVFPNS
ncbi:hypothetical protein [Laspinema palackyanum]|uniref:hypothetical protein n=1 Tax=Laspinema palackyanum TaxID=3231601 RepID=UPI00345D027F|nr:YbjN domain-containing protein [Laspinema sp. D2c]